MALANEVFRGSFRRHGGVVNCELQSCRLDLKPDEADLQCRVGKVGGGGGEGSRRKRNVHVRKSFWSLREHGENTDGDFLKGRGVRKAGGADCGRASELADGWARGSVRGGG